MSKPRLMVVGLVAGLLVGCLATARAAESLRLYVGTNTPRTSPGIYVLEFDPATGRLGEPVLAAETTNPSFLALHPKRPLLFAVGELASFEGKKAGAVSAFSIDRETGKLALLNQQPSGGPGPCHVTVDRSGRCVLVANYSGGSVASLPVGDDGSLGPAASFVQHEGSSVDPRRQKGPHAHGIYAERGGRFVLVPDLGLDKVLVYRLSASGKLAANDLPSGGVAPGAGPRHLAFHPSGRYIYVINEMASTLTAFAWDARRGALEEIQTVSTLPEGFEGNNSTAEVVAHPSGKFLYGSNRGHDSIAIFTIDEATGKLTAAGHESTRGNTPRNFNLDPSGTWLVAANQNSDNLTVFRVDARTGKLRFTGQSVTVGAPVCIEFARP